MADESDKRFDILIVGAGHGGAQAAIALRQRGFVGSIAIVGAEPEVPYERPPLSKEYLSGEIAFERLLIRPREFWTDRKVSMLTGRRIDRVDPAAHVVVTDAGDIIAYKELIWAAGGHARRLTCSGHDLVGVHSVRTRADVDRIAAELPAANQIVVIGGGYIGLEAAAILAQLGKQVTVLEALDRVLARVAGEALSRFFEAEHRGHGVDVRLNAKVDCIAEHERRVTGVRLADGEVIPAQMAIIGVGITPSVEPLLDAGAEGGNGVAVDGYCRTSLPDVFAIGDCALHANAYADELPIRLESVQNANDMAETVARAITGQPGPYKAVPWFWSNQYDLRLQTVGVSAGHDEEVMRGNVASRSFSIIYLKQGRVVALDCVNSTRDYVQGKRLVTKAAVVPAGILSDVAIPIKNMVFVPTHE